MRRRREAESEQKEDEVGNQLKVLNLVDPFHVW